jgi:hypothetical protein
LLTKIRGALLDGGAHKATDMVSWEEDGRDKRRGVEVGMGKLSAERERGVSRERAGCVLCGRTRQGREKSKKSGQTILACLGRLSLASLVDAS